MAPGFFKDEELTPTYALQRALISEYGPSDKRIKKIEKAVTFRVDGSEIYEGADAYQQECVYQPITRWLTVAAAS